MFICSFEDALADSCYHQYLTRLDWMEAPISCQFATCTIVTRRFLLKSVPTAAYLGLRGEESFLLIFFYTSSQDIHPEATGGGLLIASLNSPLRMVEGIISSSVFCAFGNWLIFYRWFRLPPIWQRGFIWKQMSVDFSNHTSNSYINEPIFSQKQFLCYL